jgi:hypothetical protein
MDTTLLEKPEVRRFGKNKEAWRGTKCLLARIIQKQ